MRSIRAGVGLVLGALALSGCAVFNGTPSASQPKTIGNVAVQFSVCASQPAGATPGSCSNEGNSNGTAGNGPSQLWMGFRVPTGSVAPSSFTSSSTGPTNSGPQLTFTQSSAYTSELQRLQPAASGEQWVGYVSQWVNYSSTTGDQNFTATADFGLPQSSTGAPFAGPFTYQLVVGGRQYFGSGSTPAVTEGIDCQQSLTTGYSTSPTGDSNWICVDDQSPSTLGQDASLATRDAGIVPGSKVTVKAGKKAKTHFTFEYSGPAPGASFTLTASSHLRGAKLSVSPKTITPSGTSSTPVTVTVTVPKGAKATTYKIKLTATLPDGESRTGTDVLAVKAVEAARKKTTKHKATTKPKKATAPAFTG